MDLSFVVKGGCNCLKYLQAALLMAKAYHIFTERIVTATETFQIIFALNFTTTDRQFPFFFPWERYILSSLLYWYSHLN